MKSEYAANQYMQTINNNVVVGKDFMKPGTQRNRTKQNKSMFAWVINLFK